MAKYVFGIDLGTTYSCISYVDETGRAIVVNNKEGTNTTPSVVNFADPSSVVVGQIAKDTAVIEPQNTISLVKTLMGKSDFAIKYNNEDLSPEVVSSYILRKLVADAEEMLDTEISDVVITCPAYFGTAERTATKNAGTIAGLNVIEVISEPTAAALYYGCAKVEGEKTILVYDLGGGTFDVTVMKIAQGEIEVICSDGNHDLGGKDWDRAVMNYLASKFQEETGQEFTLDEYGQQDLALKAERAKQQLTAKEEVPVMLDSAGVRARITLSRTVFDEITEVLLNETLDKTDDAMDETSSRGLTVDEILLVGGSTKMPQVKDRILEKYKLETKVLEPDEAVAKGAAIYALGAYEVKVIQWKEKIEKGEVDLSNQDVKAEAEKYKEAATVTTDAIPSLRGRVIDEVVTVATTKSYALEVLVGGEPQCSNQIFKNVKMEQGTISASNVYGTAVPNQTNVELVVYESDFTTDSFDVDEDYLLGKAVLELPPNLPEGAPIQVTFTLNNEGILSVYGLDKTGNREIHATMKAASGTTMTSEDVEKARRKTTGIRVE